VNILQHSGFRTGAVRTAAAATALLSMLPASPLAEADNNRLNSSVVQMINIVQYKAGCRNNLSVDAHLRQAAQWHAVDILNNRALDGDTGSDGSSPQSRADAAGYRGVVQGTVAINPALAISGMELINQWYWNPTQLAVMENCANAQIGVWSENSLDRTVVVAVYGNPPN
jgi:uncharacterized protein YkwD